MYTDYVNIYFQHGKKNTLINRQMLPEDMVLHKNEWWVYVQPTLTEGNIVSSTYPTMFYHLIHIAFYGERRWIIQSM